MSRERAIEPRSVRISMGVVSGLVLLLLAMLFLVQRDPLGPLFAVLLAVPAIQLIVAALRGRAWMNIILWRIFPSDGP